MHISTSLKVGALFAATLLTLPCLSQPIADVDPVSNGNIDNSDPSTNSTVQQILSDPALQDPEILLTVDAHLSDPSPDPRAIVIIIWMNLLRQGIADAHHYVGLFGYDHPVDNNEFQAVWKLMDSRDYDLAVTVSKADGPDLIWGVVWDTFRYLLLHVDRYRDAHRINFIPSLAFTSVRLDAPIRLAKGELKVKRRQSGQGQEDPRVVKVSIA